MKRRAEEKAVRRFVLFGALCAQDLCINVQSFLNHLFGGKILANSAAGLLTQFLGETRVAEHLYNNTGKYVFIGGLHEEAAFTVFNNLGGGSPVESDGRQSVGHRGQQRIAQSFEKRGQKENIQSRVDGLNVFDEASKDNVFGDS